MCPGWLSPWHTGAPSELRGSDTTRSGDLARRLSPPVPPQPAVSNKVRHDPVPRCSALQGASGVGAVGNAPGGWLWPQSCPGPTTTAPIPTPPQTLGTQQSISQGLGSPPSPPPATSPGWIQLLRLGRESCTINPPPPISPPSRCCPPCPGGKAAPSSVPWWGGTGGTCWVPPAGQAAPIQLPSSPPRGIRSPRPRPRSLVKGSRGVSWWVGEGFGS